MRSGIKILSDIPGTGSEIEKQHTYFVRLKMWLNQGDPVKWDRPWGTIDRATLENNGEILLTDLHINRSKIMNGLFYGVEGMKIGGTRKLKISPNLAYGKDGVPGIIPENAVLIAEIHIIEERIY